VPLGYLSYKSGMFPKALGAVLIVGGIAEIWMVLYLLVWGVTTVKPMGRGIAKV